MDKQKYLKAQRVYTVGYLLSAALTLSVYVMTMSRSWSATLIAVLALTAAALQLVAQSRFFLHLKAGRKSRWKLVSYVFTWLMLLVVVIGSLWVMMNLNYNMHMTSDQMLQKIQNENKKGF